MEKRDGKKRVKKNLALNFFVGIAAVLLFRYFRGGRRREKDEESD